MTHDECAAWAPRPKRRFCRVYYSASLDRSEHEWFPNWLLRVAIAELSELKPVSHAVHHRPWDRHRAVCHLHTIAFSPLMNACKHDVEGQVIVLVYCNRVYVCEAVSASWPGIHPCVLWTELLADAGKCSRSGEAVRQDFPSLFLHASSAPLAHFADPSSAFSTSSSSHFPCLDFCSRIF